MPSAAPWKPQNQLLENLPDDVCERLRREMQVVELPKDKVLYEVGALQSQVYFVRSGIVSLQYVTASGEAGEIAMVGQEGMVGVALMVDSSAAPSRAVVQVPGEALALKAEIVDHEFRRGGPFQVMMLRYTQMLLSQMAQAAICSRHHSIEKQLARWLLLGFDRIPRDEELRVTHEAIATCSGYAAKASPKPPAACRKPNSSATAEAASACWTASAWKPTAASATAWSGMNTRASWRRATTDRSRVRRVRTGTRNHRS